MMTLPPTTPPPSPRVVRRGKFFLYALLLIVVGLIWLSTRPHVQATILEWPKHSFWENVVLLVGGNDTALKGEAEDRINFLLLGQGGVKHDGPYLTDTIMVASLKPSTNQLALISIPRDLVVPIPNYGVRKINSANAFGEEKKPGGGIELATETVSQLLGLPIHYYVRLNFEGFEKIVNQLGGLPINVEQAFTDNEYPTEDNGYMTVSFQTGWQVMPGERVLQYVRSRHSIGGQGSDFARAKRQQQVMAALKDKLLSSATFLNPSLAIRLYRLFNDSVETNISAIDAVKLAHTLRGIKMKDIISRVFDNTPSGLLHEDIGVDGAYILVPNTADYSELKTAAANIFEVNRVAQERARLIIENGTTIAELGKVTADSLKSQGFNIVKYSNAVNSDYPRTLIYDYTSGAKPTTRQILEAVFNTKAISLEKPADDEVAPDFRIIIGANSIKQP